MADLYADTSGSPLENPDLIALTTVLSGLATAIAGYAIAQATYMRDAGNYGLASAMDDILAPMALVGMLFLLGGYLGAAAFWLASRRSVDIVPLRVAVAAVTAGALAFGAVLLVGTVFDLGRYFAMAITLLTAYYGARLTTGLRRAKPADARLRLARVALTVGTLAVTTVLVSYRPTGWPGAQAPLAARDAWAKETFKDHYAQATAFVKGCSDVTGRLGAVTAIGPAPGTNTVFYGPGESSGDFTLEVVGQKATALVHAATQHPYDPKKAGHEWAITGEILDGPHAVVLGCR